MPPASSTSTSVSPGLYTKGTLVWVEDKNHVWRCCRLICDYKVGQSELAVEDTEDPSVQVKVKVSQDGTSLPPLKNPEILIGSNDLTSLSYLHEPAVLYNLKVRFLDQRSIYTWCGIVLVAVNPFTDLAIYGDETISTYHESASSGSTQLDPHIYAVAEDAYSKLERESRNQSLIVSGESGAGKTVSAKFAMRYFASIASSNGGCTSDEMTSSALVQSGSTLSSVGSIENRVLASNPIMEAIGNAKTTRNDNSSRFGKYIQIMFDPTNRRSIVGGNMRTYLLEKSRVSKQNEGERNFHIFYQMCHYAKVKKWNHLMLYEPSGRYYPFSYLGSIEPTESDDMTKFNEAMLTLGFNERQQDLIYKIVSAILHAGDIEFRKVSDEECSIPMDDRHLVAFCTLLGLDESATRQWLTHRVLRTGMKEVIVTPVNKTAAESGRDAFAKFIYEKMFAWVVFLINRSLGVTKESLTSTFIGVLDIYGFEHFDSNSFEQFCINYANEVLQQQFNQHVFKLEQEEYVREGIDWTFISFTDNQPVIDLIEAKLGILNLLDEECKMPKGTDESWNQKLYNQLSSKFEGIFEKPKIGSRDTFIIKHFADKVTYTVHGILGKNRDTVWEEQIDLLKRSQMLESLFSADIAVEGPVIKAAGKTKISSAPPPAAQAAASKASKATVGSQFRDSLAALMKILNSTTPHYVRCIKSNDDKAPFEFDNVRAVQQLRACGVLETIRISSNGFPSRWTYQDFANRYRVLLVGVHRFVKKKVEKEGGPPVPIPRKLIKSGSSTAAEVKAVCEQIVKIVYELQVYSQFKTSTSEPQSATVPYQFGKSKIFFRSGQVALLERIRTQRLRECAILIQKTVKGFIYRRRFLKIRETVLKIQTYGRGLLARRLLWNLKTNHAALIIQRNWRMYMQRKRYTEIKKSVVGLQKYGRAFLARRRFLAIQKESATLVIQKFWRGYKARKEYHKKLRQIILVQTCIRRHFARKQLKQLKIEARSVAHVQQLNKGLERKIIELQQRLNETAQELKGARNREVVADGVKDQISRMDMEIKNLRNIINDKEKDIDKLREEIESKEKYNATLEKKLQEQLKTIEKLSQLNKKMESSVVDKDAVKVAVAEKEKSLFARFEQEKKIFMEELESEKYAHQQLLRKYAAMEDRLEKFAGMENGTNGEAANGIANPSAPDMSTVSLMMKCSELEQECAKIKHENQQMRELLADMSSSEDDKKASSLLAKQVASMQVELDRTKEEKSHLKTIVLGQETSISKSGDSEVIAAFKMIVKQLEREVESEKINNASLQAEISSLKKDNERQQQMIGLKISSELPADDANTDFITRINQENMLLREKCDRLTNDNKKLRIDVMRHQILENGADIFGTEEGVVGEVGKNFLGMFKFTPQKEHLLLDILITHLEPQTALKFPPHLPAYIVFMCVRYTDEVNDEQQVRSLLNGCMMTLKRIVKRAVSQHDVEILVMWMANVVKFIALLKQFSGEEQYGALEESLKNFDLSEYRELFADIAVWTYQGLIKQSEERIQPLIVPAILEYEGLASSGLYTQPKQRSASVTEDNPVPPSPTDKPVDSLVKELSYLHKILLLHVVEADLISQIFKQLFYFICSSALNNLLLRKDLCHWNKAMQIRFNLSVLEQWAREQQIPKCNEIVEKLDPIIQATKLLQTKKTEEHIPTIVETTFRLSSAQILKILNMYTAGDEETISPAFMKKIKNHLGESRKEPANAPLLMETKKSFPLMIPYNPTDIDLRKISLPPVLLKKGLGTVLTKI